MAILKGEKLDRCVSDLMSDPNFKPRSGQTKEEAAFAVCNSRVGKQQDPRCPPGFRYVEAKGKCVPMEKRGTEDNRCPAGQEWKNGKCVPMSEKRGDGTRVMPVNGKCPPGHKMKDGVCVLAEIGGNVPEGGRRPHEEKHYSEDVFDQMSMIKRLK